MAHSLEGRIAVIFGLANKRSIAWAIAQKLHAEGAQIAITYQNERLGQEAIQAHPGGRLGDRDLERRIGHPLRRRDGEPSST